MSPFSRSPGTLKNDITLKKKLNISLSFSGQSDDKAIESKPTDNPIINGISKIDIESTIRDNCVVIVDEGRINNTTDVSSPEEFKGQEKENPNFMAHTFADIQLVASYITIIYVAASTSASSAFVQYQNIMGQWYYSMLLSACLALMLDPMIDASLNFSQPISKGKILHRYRSNDGLYVYLSLCICNFEPFSFIKKLDNPAIPSEQENAEFSTFEQLICGRGSKEERGGEKSAQNNSGTKTVSPDTPDGDDADCNSIEYKWLEAIYCLDQVLRWFYLPYIFRMFIVAIMMFLRLILCRPLVMLGVIQCRFVYLAFRHHAENEFITRQILFFAPLLFGLVTHVLLGWLAFSYIFIAIFIVCFIIKLLLDKLVAHFVGKVTNQGVLKADDIYSGSSIVVLVRYVALKFMWRTFLVFSTQIGFNYATLIYSGQPYIDIIGNEDALRNSDCFYQNIMSNSLVFFNWV